MKKALLFILMAATLTSFGQIRQAGISTAKKDIRLPYVKAASEVMAPSQNYNPYVSTKSVLEAEIIGNTFYDLQTNGSMAQRLYMTEDGKMGAVWTRGITATSYPDRGTGYNYFDGTAWGPAPTSRIETIRTGFPSIAQWNGTGEIVVAHPSAGNLKLSKRATAGTGPWTTTDVPTPTGAIDPSWPSIMTSGPNHEIIHIIALSLPEASGGAPYNGLDGAMLYWRSRDGGATWEKEGIQVPQMLAPEYVGFSADAYSWAFPKGDTIAFVYGDNWTDVFVMYSFDAGDTWNKITVLGNQYKGQAPGQVVLPFYSTDGSNSLAIDKDGVFHVAFGRMRNSEDADGRVWYPYTDGLVYWNSTMPQLQDSLFLDTLEARGQLVAYVESNLAGDSILSIPYYNVGMTSYPNLHIDEETDRVMVVYSGVVVDNPSNDVNFRHVKGSGTCRTILPDWSDDMVDFNEGIDDMYLEFVFPSAAKRDVDEFIHYIVQSSDVPGSAVLQTTIPAHDNNIIYNKIAENDILLPCPQGIKEISSINSVSNSPNPFSGSTTVTIETTKSGQATLSVITVSGLQVMSREITLKSGRNEVVVDGSSLSAGVYLYTVRMNGFASTGRMIVK